MAEGERMRLKQAVEGVEIIGEETRVAVRANSEGVHA